MHLASTGLVPPGRFLSRELKSPLSHLCSRADVDVYESVGHRHGPSNDAIVYADVHSHRCDGTRDLSSQTRALWTWMNGGHGDGGDDGVSSCDLCCVRGLGGVSLDRLFRVVSPDFPRSGIFQSPPMSLLIFCSLLRVMKNSWNKRAPENTGGGVE